MKNINLDSDEGIIKQTKNVERYQVGDKYTEILEMYLTNKNLILIYEKSTGLFKTEDVVEKVALDDIRVIKGKVQVFKVDDNDYGWGMQIIFKDGACDHFVFEKEKEIQPWINSITEMLIEESESKKEKLPKDNNDDDDDDVKKEEPKKETKEEIEERKTVYDGKIHKCPNCGEVLKSFMTNCPACGFELSRKEINESLKEFIDKINECEKEINNNNYNKKGWSSWSKSQKIWWIILNVIFVCIPLVIYWVLPLVLINKTPKLSKEEQQMAKLIENFPFPNDRESILAALVFAKEKVSFAANVNVDQKTAYWLRLWNTKAEQLKQKADMLFPNDPIVKKSYDDIIKAVDNVNKIIKTKAIIGMVILAIAIIFLIVRYSSNSSYSTKINYNVTFEWQTNGLFAKLPVPETNNGKIVSETEDRIQIELYHITEDEFDQYVKKCRNIGFTEEITKTDRVFYSKDEKGYDLDIYYDGEKQVMEINLDSQDVEN